MKKIFLASVILFIFITANGQQSTPNASIIPIPVSMTMGDGVFEIRKKITIISSGDANIRGIAERLADRLKKATTLEVSTKEDKKADDHSVFLSLSSDKSIPKEGYRLEVKSSHVSITASTAAGIFYGVQTLFQLLPPSIESSTATPTQWSIPSTTIEDYPRFGWRGLMLDVARHFFTVAEVKQYIDDMVKYKFNLLHLHLSDDQGWRIQIKALPKLTEVGAWRVDKTGTFGGFSKPEPNEPRSYGGYYTHDDIKELVKYASDRYVNIMPEIDMPGHSLAFIASYPEVVCTPGTYTVNSGERLMIWPPGGHFYGTIDNSLCPANEKVYDYIDKIFTEIAQLFPFEYIHMGGDETARNFWEKSAAIKSLMAKQKLKNLDEVQSYFVKRVAKIISAKGKKLMGWDEILEGGLAPNAAVMNWRGIKYGIDAAKQGHEVVMSPTEFAYIDYMQGDAVIEPPVYASLRLKKTYQFDPIREGIDPKMVKGGQANLWTEQVYNMRHAQYMTWPRGFAIAEALWSPKEKKDWNNFARRVEDHFKRFDEAQVKYAPSIHDPIFEVKRKDSTIIVTLSTEIDGLNIHYSFDNSFPDQYYPKYMAPLNVPKDAVAMKVITYRGNKVMGRMIVMPVAELKRRAR